VSEIKPLSVELVLVFYNFCNQHGVVDIKAAAKWTKDKYGIIIKDKEFVLLQKHIDFLMDNNAIPDTRVLLKHIFKYGAGKSDS
jgi:hypothetical protein